MDREEIYQITLRKFLEPVGVYIDDPDVTEIMINGTDEVYIEKHGLVEETDVCFEDEELLLSAARNIAQYTNKRITQHTARFDSRLTDGSRVHVVMPMCSRKGLCISIRKFAEKNFTLEGLARGGSLTQEAKEYIELVVGLEKNVIVSGGTGSGKTSLLNAMSLKIPRSKRIIVIEDSTELKLQQPHVLSFETTQPDKHGHGGVTIRELFHSALRMRPDRIVIGECRGGEALDLIQAMTSGHGGSMSTLHANTAFDALNRLETMALMSKVEIPQKALRTQIASAIQVVIQLTRFDSGERIVTEVSEVGPLDDDGGFRLASIYKWVGGGGSASGGLSWSGFRSAFTGELKQSSLWGGVNLTKEVFAEPGRVW
jgi:pilus assembly protein CpaF